MKERHQQERQQLRGQYRPFPDFEHWLRQQQQPELAAAWRHRAGEPQRINGDTTEPPTPRDIRAYMPKIHGQQVHYIRKDDATHAGQSGAASFVDKGREIDIHDWRNQDCVLAALQLSAQKWGSFQVNGNDDYKVLCVKLAAEHGFKISNPELQASIESERQRMRVVQKKTPQQPAREPSRVR